jgi:hypothetical protein
VKLTEGGAIKIRDCAMQWTFTTTAKAQYTATEWRPRATTTAGKHPLGTLPIMCAHPDHAKTTAEHSPSCLGVQITGKSRKCAPRSVSPPRVYSPEQTPNLPHGPPPARLHCACFARIHLGRRRQPSCSQRNLPAVSMARPLSKLPLEPTPTQSTEVHAPRQPRNGPRRRCPRTTGQNLSTRASPHPRPRLMLLPSTG